MSVPSKCPRCEQPVMVPDGLSAEARLRCPLCSAEFSASEALAAAPPLLVVVDLGLGPADSATAAQPTPAQAEQSAAPSDAGALEAAVQGAAETSDQTAPAGEQETEQPAGAVLSEAASVPEVWQQVDQAPQIDLGQPDAEPGAGAEAVDVSAFAGLAEEQQPAEAEGAVERLLSARRPPGRRQEKSLARELVGIVLGGFVGLTLGYYLLNLFGGERFFYFPVYMPGVAHSQNSWPFGPKESSQQDQAQPTGAQGSTPSDAGQQPTGASGSAGWSSARQPGPSDRGSPARKPTEPSAASSDQQGAGAAESSAGNTTPQGGSAEAPGDSSAASDDAQAQTSAPEPQPPSAPAVGPIDAPAYSSDEVKTALNKTHSLFGCWQCNSTGTVVRNGQRRPCPRCKGEPNLELSPEAYDAFCRLAETITFLAEDDQTALVDQRRATETVLEWLARAPGQLDMASRFAMGTLQAGDGQLRGVLLVGTAGAISQQNGLFGTMIQLRGIPSSYLLLSDRPLPFGAAEEVVILGTVVPEPAKRVRGYSGTKPIAVWLGAAVKVEP